VRDCLASIAGVPLKRIKPEDKSAFWQPKKSVRLYFDDIEAISQIMNRTGGVVATTSDFTGTMTSPQDLKVDARNRLSDCQLKFSDGEKIIEVHLGTPVGIKISPSDDNALAGASAQIQTILNQSQRPFTGIETHTEKYSPIVLLGFLAFVIGIVMVFVSYFGTTPAKHHATGTNISITAKPLRNVSLGYYGEGAALIGAALILGLAYCGRNPTPRGTVVLAYRVDAPTWWKRNRVAVTISFVSSLVSGVVFFLLGRALGP
jgi:hypothetical protein